MAIEAVLWDLDGTLIATHRLYPEAYRLTLKRFLGRELTNEEMFVRQFRSEIEFLRHHAGEDYEASTREFARHYADLHSTHFDGIFPGILPVLAEIRRRGLKMGIVTGKTRSSYEITVQTADLGQFDVLVMDDDVDSPKPHPQGILAALDAIAVKPAAAIYIGDSITDIEAALAAGTHAAAALWSKKGEFLRAFEARLRAHPVAHILREPTEVLSKI